MLPEANAGTLRREVATVVAYGAIWGYHARFFCQIQLYGVYSSS